MTSVCGGGGVAAPACSPWLAGITLAWEKGSVVKALVPPLYQSSSRQAQVATAAFRAISG